MQRQTQLANEVWPLLLPKVAAMLAGVRVGAAGGGAGGEVGEHALSGGLHTGALADVQAPQFLKLDGSRALTGNLAVATGVTIDGVDLSAHAADPDAHHARLHGILSGADHSVTGAAFQVVGLTATNTLGLLTPSSDVRSGTVEALLKSNAAGEVALKGLAIGAAMTLAGTNNIATAPDIQFGSNGLLAAESSLYFSVDSNNTGTDYAFIFGHNAGTSAFTELARLTDASVLRFTGTTPTISTAANGLTVTPATDLLLQPGGDLVLDPTGNDVLPATNYDINLGAINRKYLTLWAAELWVETLVAQETIATIGGRILVGPTTTLTRDLGSAAGDTTIYVKHNQMSAGDRVYMEAAGKVEFMAVTSAYTLEAAGDYSYTVTRNLDGSGRNLWYAGDAVFNTGQVGNGFIDLYSLSGIPRQGQSGQRAGPTIVGNVRLGTTYNNFRERWAIGKLNALYDYSNDEFGAAFGDPTAAWIGMDATNGVRVMAGAAKRLQMDMSGNLRLYNSGGTNVIALDSDGTSYFAGVMTIGTDGEIRQGTGTLGSNYTGLRIWRDGSIGRIAGYNANVVQWSGDTDGVLRAGAGAVEMGASGYRVNMDTYDTAGTRAIKWAPAGDSTPRFSIVGGYDSGTGAVTAGLVLRPVTSNAATDLYIATYKKETLPYAYGNIYMLAALVDVSPGTLRANLVNAGGVTPTTATVDIGTAGNPFRALYVQNIVADTITGGTALSGSVWQYDAGDMYVRSSSAAARTLYVANPGTGTMHLDVEGNIVLGGTVDGVDLSGFYTAYSVHVGDANIHHNRQHSLASTSDHTASGLTAGWVLRATGATTFAWQQLLHSDLGSLTTGDPHTQYALRSTEVLGGAGLTGGGDLTANRTFGVGAGTLITVGADDVGLSNGTAQYQVIVTGATPFAPAYAALSTFAGNGLSFSAGKFVVGTTGLGLDTTATQVRLTSSSNPGAAAAILASDAAGGLTLQELLLGTAMTLSSSGNVATAPDIQFTGSGLLAAQTSLYIALDSDGDAPTGASLIVGHGSSTTVGFLELARFTNTGRLGIGDASPSYELDVTGTARATVALRTATTYATTKVQSPLLDTATGQDMTIAPAGDLYLSPVGLDVVVSQTAALRSDNFLKTILTAGFRIGPTSVAGQTGIQAGSAEFDELRVRIFVADETRVDRGQWYLTKSYGILSRSFTVPASVGGTAFLYVENSPQVAGALFSANDWVMLVYLDMSGGIVLTRVWGQVSSYTTTGLTGEQRWTFTLRSGTGGLEFAKGALALDFGASGQGYILMDAVTATSPSIQVGRWVTNPYTPANYSVLTQMGRLDGVGFTGEYGLAASVSGYGVDAPWIKVSTTGAQLNNLPLLWTSGGTVKGSIAAWDDIWFGPSSSDKRLYWNGTTAGVVGQVVAESGYIGTAAAGWTISEDRISANGIRLIAARDTTDSSRIELGNYTASGSGQLAVIGMTGVTAANVTTATIAQWAGRNWFNRGTAPYRLTYGGSLYASDATLVGSLTAGGGNVVLDENGERIYRATEIVTTGSLPPVDFALSPNLTPVSSQALQLRDTAATFTRTGSPSSYAYPGNPLLSIYTSSRHWTPPADPTLWEHHLYGVIEVPTPTQVGLGTWSTRLWLKANAITLDSVAGVAVAGGLFADGLFVTGNAYAGGFVARGDGGGETGAVAFSNVTDTTVSTGTGTVKMNSTTARNSDAWVKIYIGTTAYWIPAWSNIN